MDSMIGVLGVVLGVLGLGFGFLQWRRLAAHGEALQSAYAQADDAKKSAEQCQSESHKTKEKLEQARAQLRKAEKTLEDSSQKCSDLARKLKMTEEQGFSSEKRLQLKVDDLTEQFVSIKQQLAESVTELKNLKKSRHDSGLSLKNQESQLRAESDARLSEIRDKLRQAEKQVRDLQKHNSDLEDKIKKANPRDILVMRKKVSQYVTLYNSMRGLREMSEERNENLEFALRKLAAWTLKRQGKDLDPQAKFGTLVGMALQSIGSTLVVDEHSMPIPAEGRGKDEDASARFTPSTLNPQASQP